MDAVELHNALVRYGVSCQGTGNLLQVSTDQIIPPSAMSLITEAATEMWIYGGVLNVNLKIAGE